MAPKTRKWDVAETFRDDEDMAAYLAAVFNDGDQAMIRNALGAVARAKGMTTIAKEAGVTRSTLYKALSGDGDPRMSTLTGVLRAFGLKLQAVKDETAARPDSIPRPRS